MPLSKKQQRALLVQRQVGRILAPVWIPLVVGAVRFGMGYRMRGIRELRKQFLTLRKQYPGPLLICANHLTMIDSAIIAWGLAPVWWYILHYSALAWNVPERRNFASTWINNAVVYILKCIPIVRGGDRQEVARVLDSITFLLKKGDVAMLFPEGGRTRTGRVEVSSAAYGVGRVLKKVPGCRVLCVYLRGDHQDAFSNLPVWREAFHMDFTCIEPKSELRGMRGSRELSMQIVNEISQMEQKYFDARQ